MVDTEANEFIDKITDTVYLGCMYGVNEISYLKSEGITHILSMCFIHPNVTSQFFCRKSINTDDNSNENIFKYFKEAIDFIESADKVYVHCMAGVSRSPTIVIAYLMWKNKLTYNDAYWIVCNKRKFIYPNDGFKKQLHKFEKVLLENNWELDKIDFQSK